MNIEWDEEKNKINIKKHKISFELAANVFTDPLRKETYDVMHSDTDEDRLIVIGIAKERLLFVCFCEPDFNTIRIISARNVTRKERRYYYGNC